MSIANIVKERNIFENVWVSGGEQVRRLHVTPARIHHRGQVCAVKPAKLRPHPRLKRWIDLHNFAGVNGVVHFLLLELCSDQTL